MTRGYVWAICPICKKERKGSFGRGHFGFFLSHTRQNGVDGRGRAIMIECSGTGTRIKENMVTSDLSRRKAS